MEIFTNRGVLVWNSDDYENDWDGTDYNGSPLVEGVYYYVVIRPEDITQPAKIDRGWVHILR